jgi:hypothetical protein
MPIQKNSNAEPVNGSDHSSIGYSNGLAALDRTLARHDEQKDFGQVAVAVLNRYYKADPKGCHALLLFNPYTKPAYADTLPAQAKTAKRGKPSINLISVLNLIFMEAGMRVRIGTWQLDGNVTKFTLVQLPEEAPKTREIRP